MSLIPSKALVFQRLAANQLQERIPEEICVVAGYASSSRERDFALDSVVQHDALDLDPGADLQLLVAPELAAQLAHGALDLTLGSDAHFL